MLDLVNVFSCYLFYTLNFKPPCLKYQFLEKKPEKSSREEV